MLERRRVFCAQTLGLGLAMSGLVAVWGCGDRDSGDKEATAASAPPAETATAHERMVGRLAEIARATDRDNHWLGEAGAPAVLSRLERLSPNAPPAERFRLLLQAAEQELRLGRETQALARFDDALSMLQTLRGALPDRELQKALFRAGVAWLRHAETANCGGAHVPGACILPLTREAVHRDRGPARRAIDAFESLLSSLSPASPLHLKTVWLLNLAYMTIGGYPHEVPTQWAIPAEIFSPSSDLERMPNVAPHLGIDTFNLSGGAVVDDLDGDGIFDLFATTFDTRESPRLFRGNGDGTFSDQTSGSGLEELFGGLNVVHGDYDNDGDADLFVLRGAWLVEQGRHPNSLLLQRWWTLRRCDLRRRPRGAGVPHADGVVGGLRPRWRPGPLHW